MHLSSGFLNYISMKIGVISDTHGYIQPAVFNIFSDVDLILHAGDIGNEDVITALETLAPVKAIHGNVDVFPILSKYPETLTLELKGVSILMIHQFIGLHKPEIQRAREVFSKKRIDVLIFGHTHQAKIENKDQTLLLNPGAAGKPRFTLKPSVGLLYINNEGNIHAEICYL